MSNTSRQIIIRELQLPSHTPPRGESATPNGGGVGVGRPSPMRETAKHVDARESRADHATEVDLEIQTGTFKYPTPIVALGVRIYFSASTQTRNRLVNIGWTFVIFI
jgi:hypothetical protein